MSRTITPEVFKKIVDLHSQGLNPTAIGKEVGVAKDTVKAHLLKNNIAPNVRGLAIKESSYKEFIEEVKAGANWSVIRRKFKISFDKAKSVLIENGIEPKDRKAAAEAKRLTKEDIQNKLGEEFEYIGFENKKHILKDKDGRVFKKAADKLWQGSPFGKGGGRLSVDDAAKKLLSLGFTLKKETFVNTKIPLIATCNICGSSRNTRYTQFFIWGCESCSNVGESIEEKTLDGWIRSLGFETQKPKLAGNKTKNKTIDIYVESKKLGIEYCGLYWHNENSPEPRPMGYHKGKMDTFKAQYSAELLTIFEDEWLERNSQVKSYILSKLGLNERVFARECQLRELEKWEEKAFMETNHIQGPGHSKICFGLIKDGQILAAMSFGGHHRNGDEMLVLNRLCFKSGITVVGGASKLLSAGIKWAKIIGHTEIVSWSDNRWSEGKVYEKLGFILDNELSPDYSYVKGQKRIPKQSCQKKHLLAKGAVGNTELEMAKSLGYKRIWDCGKKKWLLKI
jgi:hypothetical protein